MDLVADTLDSCRDRIDEAMPKIRDVQAAVDEQRGLRRPLAVEMRAELLTNRRQWENRLPGHTASRWGFSPFALVLRVYQGLGGLLAGALLYRARTPAQMALWGALRAFMPGAAIRKIGRPIGVSTEWPPRAGIPPVCARPL